MALQSSGQISFSNINTELSKSATTSFSLNDADVRDLASVYFGQISLSNFYGKSKKTYGYVCGFCYEGQSITLNAPRGTFTRLLFAVYGTPCPCPGNPSPSNLPSIYCESSGGITDGAVCSSYVDFSGTNVNGSTSITFNAYNSTWGDPCGGVYKQMTIVAEYYG